MWDTYPLIILECFGFILKLHVIQLRISNFFLKSCVIEHDLKNNLTYYGLTISRRLPSRSSGVADLENNLTFYTKK